MGVRRPRCTHELLDWIVGQRLSYSVGFTLPDRIVDELALVPDTDWQPAYDADREPRDGAWVLEVTGLLDLTAESIARRRPAARRPSIEGSMTTGEIGSTTAELHQVLVQWLNLPALRSPLTIGDRAPDSGSHVRS